MIKRLISALCSSAAIGVLVLLLTGPAAEATFPGRPGRILFDESPSESACGGGQIVTIDPDGLDRTDLAVGSQGAFSADGSEIAFVSCNGDTRSQVSVMGADGGDPREVISERDFSASQPSFSPSGRQIVFVRSEYKGEGTSDLMVASAEGTDRRAITATPNSSEADPSYSPNGLLIIFESSGIHSEGRHVFTIHPDGTRLRKLGAGSQPSISPDGRFVVFDRRGSIWQMRIDGRGAHLIKAAGVPAGATNPDPNFESFKNSHPVYSPDGRRILFVRHRMLPDFGPSPQNYILWTMLPDGDHTEKIPFGPGGTVAIERAPEWQSR